MQDFIRKKFFSLLLVIFFSVASFGSFALVANATIATELISILNLSISPSELYALPELPEELTSAQRAKVLDGIIIEALVRKAAANYEIASLGVESAQAKQQAAQETYDRLFGICSRRVNPDCPTDSQVIWAKGQLDGANKELDIAELGNVKVDPTNIGLNKAKSNLVEALINARRAQNSVITAMIPEGQAARMFDSAVKQLTESQKAFSDSTANVGNVDTAQSGTQQLVNPDDMNDSIEFGGEVLKFLADEQADKLNGMGFGSTGSATGAGTAGGEVVAGSFIVGSSYSIKTAGSTDFIKIGASSNAVGTVFKATEVGSGTGTAVSAGGAGAGGAIVPPRKPTDDLVASIHKACTNIITAFMPCVADGFYYVIYKPASYALKGAGMIFDFILALSIDNSKNMIAPKFVDKAWAVVRDFSNMLFIFVLLYTGIMTMFGMADSKKVVIKVVVIALLINFSLFFTKVVIDAGNVLAVGIKSAIGNDSLSAGLVDSFKPQRFLVVAAGADPGSDQALNAIVVFIIAGVVSGFAAYYFFKAALLFFGRLLGFWFLMIVSPFVFVSTALPAGDQMKKWFSSLLGLTFAAPVFLFLVYLLTMIISAGDGILSQFSKIGIGWFNFLLGPVMAATLIVLALKKILDITGEMSGAFGEIGAKMVNVAMTGAMGVSGIVARQTLGRGAAAMLRRSAPKTEEELARMDPFDRKLYEGGRGLLRGASKSSFDVRNIGDKNSLIGKTISGKIFQKEQGLGGRVKVAENEAKELEAKIKKKELNIFEEEGIRRNREAGQKAAEESLKEAEQGKEGAKRQVEVEEDILEATKESGKAQLEALNNLETASKEASARAERDKGSVYESESSAEATRLRSEFEVAQKTYSESPTTVAIRTAENKVKEAKAGLDEKEKEVKKAKELVKGKDEAKASFAIKNINKQRKEAVIEKAEKGTWFGAGADKTTVSKVRKEKESSADLLKKALKKQTEEDTESKPKNDEKEKDEDKH